MLAEHDSWLAFDPVRGCSNDCGYCFLRLEGLTRTVPAMPSASVAALGERYAAFVRDIPPDVPVSFGNVTDLLGSRELLNYFCALSSEIRKYDPNRLIVVISKARVTAGMAAQIASATAGKGLVILSQSFARDLGRQVEGGNVCTPEDTLESARIISGTEGLSCVHFWRPFLSAWNPPERLGDRIRALKDSGCRCSVLIGLKAPQALRAYFSGALLADAAAELRCAPLPGEEYLCVELADRAIAEAAACDYPIFSYTSCAVAYVSGTPDINGTAHSDAAAFRCLRAGCPPRQRAICGNDCPEAANAAEIARCRARYGDSLQIRGREISLDRPVTDYEFNHLLHIFHRPPSAAGMIQNKVWKGGVHDTDRSDPVSGA